MTTELIRREPEQEPSQRLRFSEFIKREAIKHRNDMSEMGQTLRSLESLDATKVDCCRHVGDLTDSLMSRFGTCNGLTLLTIDRIWRRYRAR